MSGGGLGEHQGYCSACRETLCWAGAPRPCNAVCDRHGVPLERTRRHVARYATRVNRTPRAKEQHVPTLVLREIPEQEGEASNGR